VRNLNPSGTIELDLSTESIATKGHGRGGKEKENNFITKA